MQFLTWPRHGLSFAIQACCYITLIKIIAKLTELAQAVRATINLRFRFFINCLFAIHALISVAKFTAVYGHLQK